MTINKEQRDTLKNLLSDITYNPKPLVDNSKAGAQYEPTETHASNTMNDTQLTTTVTLINNRVIKSDAIFLHEAHALSAALTSIENVSALRSLLMQLHPLAWSSLSDTTQINLLAKTTK